MQHAWNGECERCNRCVEIDAVVGLHAVQALHRADRRFENGTAGIAEFLTGLQVGLFADDAFMAFAGKLRPLVLTQENKLMLASPWGPHP